MAQHAWLPDQKGKYVIILFRRFIFSFFCVDLQFTEIPMVLMLFSRQNQHYVTFHLFAWFKHSGKCWLFSGLKHFSFAMFMAVLDCTAFPYYSACCSCSVAPSSGKEKCLRRGLEEDFLCLPLPLHPTLFFKEKKTRITFLIVIFRYLYNWHITLLGIL